jgi:hypothetical protein
MTRDEIVEAIRAVDERIEALLPLARARPDEPLQSGEWRVRDALSHVAARGNPVPRVLTRLNESTDSAGNPRPVRDIHEINAEQVSTRAGHDVDALIEEAREGHRAALAQLEELDDLVLERRLPVAFPPGELSVGELIVAAGPRHEGNHLNDIEAVLKAEQKAVSP